MDSKRSNRDEAFGDAIYDTWMRGGNPDHVSRERTDELCEEGYDRFEVGEIVSRELTRPAKPE